MGTAQPAAPRALAEEYFDNGWFQSDVSDLLRMVEWAVEQGAPRVRITVA